MQKKNVQISSTTLGLRFMQNAKMRQEQRETEVSRVNIQTEEQWHLATPVEWKASSGHTNGNQSILYESSYLPFIFPDSKPNAPSINEEEESNPKPRLKGRRAFGKHGKEEEITASTLPVPVPEEGDHEPEVNDSTSTSRHSPVQKSVSLSEPPSGVSNNSKARFSSKLKDGPNVFMRPNVEAPKAAKRIFEDTSEPARKKKKSSKHSTTNP